MFSRLIVSVMSLIEPEKAHRLTVDALRFATPFIVPSHPPAASLKQQLWGMEFASPLGLAAGFDKNAECTQAMQRLGFGFIEIGSVTPLPQIGNDRPRVFRSPKHQAVINRYGFNSDGMEIVRDRLEALRKTSSIHVPLGINVGKNKLSEDAVADYQKAIACLGEFASYLVVNVSSPNTPGLRSLQQSKQLSELLIAVNSTRKQLPNHPPILLKLAPDLDDQDLAEVAESCLEAQQQGLIDGVIISNTTITRPDYLPTDFAGQVGGLSGQPLAELAYNRLYCFYQLTAGKIPLVAAGGVNSGVEAYRRIKAGASLVQIYTGLIFKGTGLIKEIHKTLALQLQQDGFSSLAEAVGSAHHPDKITQKEKKLA
ncbi:MAG: quinone-dependent dihydroorotate dehydrogenase [Alphaproteobacteria bacterium]